jgi:hypothetical protein
MKRIVLVLVVLLIAFGLSAQIKFSGSTGATMYHDDEKKGVLDADQDVTIAFAPLSLALNAGYTRNFVALTNVITFGYTLSASQALGPFVFSASAASNALTIPIGGVLTGDFLGDMTAKIVATKDIVSATAYSLFTAKKGYPFFMGVDVSGTIAPKWGSFTLGSSFLVPKAAADDVGHVNTVATVEGLSFYGKMKISY